VRHRRKSDVGVTDALTRPARSVEARISAGPRSARRLTAVSGSVFSGAVASKRPAIHHAGSSGRRAFAERCIRPFLWRDSPMQAPAEDPFAWSKLLKEWLAWGAAAVVLAVAFHEAYRLLGLYT
jgi:hypothetical protein